MSEIVAARYEPRAELTSVDGASLQAAHDRWLHRDVLLLTSIGTGGDRLEDRVHALASVVHPALVEPYDDGEHRGRPFAVWPVPATTLANALADAPLEPGHAERVAESVVAGVAALHAAGVAHGALGLDSVVLDEAGRASVLPVSGAPNSIDEPSFRGDVAALAALLPVVFAGQVPDRLAGALAAHRGAGSAIQVRDAGWPGAGPAPVEPSEVAGSPAPPEPASPITPAPGSEGSGRSVRSARRWRLAAAAAVALAAILGVRAVGIEALAEAGVPAVGFARVVDRMDVFGEAGDGRERGAPAPEDRVDPEAEDGDQPGPVAGVPPAAVPDGAEDEPAASTDPIPLPAGPVDAPAGTGAGGPVAAPTPTVVERNARRPLDGGAPARTDAPTTSRRPTGSGVAAAAPPTTAPVPLADPPAAPPPPPPPPPYDTTTTTNPPATTTTSPATTTTRGPGTTRPPRTTTTAPPPTTTTTTRPTTTTTARPTTTTTARPTTTTTARQTTTTALPTTTTTARPTTTTTARRTTTTTVPDDDEDKGS